jgi:hypothetical protein
MLGFVPQPNLHGLRFLGKTYAVLQPIPALREGRESVALALWGSNCLIYARGLMVCLFLPSCTRVKNLRKKPVLTFVKINHTGIRNKKNLQEDPNCS